MMNQGGWPLPWILYIQKGSHFILGEIGKLFYLHNISVLFNSQLQLSRLGWLHDYVDRTVMSTNRLCRPTACVDRPVVSTSDCVDLRLCRPSGYVDHPVMSTDRLCWLTDVDQTDYVDWLMMSTICTAWVNRYIVPCCWDVWRYERQYSNWYIFISLKKIFAKYSTYY